MTATDFKVIIAGSRTITDYFWVKTVVDNLLEPKLSDPTVNVVIVSGTARGVDQLAIRYANEKNLQCIEMPANWDLYGKSAGYRRNVDMGNIADAAICLSRNQSRGTQHMFNIMKTLGKPVVLIDADTGDKTLYDPE